MKHLMLLAMFVLCGTAWAFDSAQALQDGFLKAMRANNPDDMAACYTADATSFGLGAMRTAGHFCYKSFDRGRRTKNSKSRGARASEERLVVQI